MKYILQLVS